MIEHELRHYGVMGMKWGKRKNSELVSTAKKSPKTKEERVVKTDKISKIVRVGASVAAGLLSSSFGAGGVYALTGSQTVASIVAPSLGVIGGMKYYEWINS